MTWGSDGALMDNSNCGENSNDMKFGCKTSNSSTTILRNKTEKTTIRDIVKKLNTEILWHQTRRGGGRVSAREEEKNEGFKKTRTPKTCFTLGLQSFGHIYSYLKSFESGTL